MGLTPVKYKHEVGDKISWRRWGGEIHTATIIECDEKNGEPVYDMDNNEWCYESQVLPSMGCRNHDANPR